MFSLLLALRDLSSGPLARRANAIVGARLAATDRPAWLVADAVESAMGFENIASDWPRYSKYLQSVPANRDAQEELGFPLMTRGWAIGTSGWRRSLAESHPQRRMNVALPAEDLHAFRQRSWQDALDGGLQELKRTAAELEQAPGRAAWKLELACRLRRDAGVSYAWIAQNLKYGTPGALRVAIHRRDERMFAGPRSSRSRFHVLTPSGLGFGAGGEDQFVVGSFLQAGKSGGGV